MPQLLLPLLSQAKVLITVPFTLIYYILFVLFVSFISVNNSNNNFLNFYGLTSLPLIIPVENFYFSYSFKFSSAHFWPHKKNRTLFLPTEDYTLSNGFSHYFLISFSFFSLFIENLISSNLDVKPFFWMRQKKKNLNSSVFFNPSFMVNPLLICIDSVFCLVRFCLNNLRKRKESESIELIIF